MPMAFIWSGIGMLVGVDNRTVLSVPPKVPMASQSNAAQRSACRYDWEIAWRTYPRSDTLPLCSR